jgi:hypothetical protein
MNKNTFEHISPKFNPTVPHPLNTPKSTARSPAQVAGGIKPQRIIGIRLIYVGRQTVD